MENNRAINRMPRKRNRNLNNRSCRRVYFLSQVSFHDDFEIVFVPIFPVLCVYFVCCCCCERGSKTRNSFLILCFEDDDDDEDNCWETLDGRKDCLVFTARAVDDDMVVFMILQDWQSSAKLKSISYNNNRHLDCNSFNQASSFLEARIWHYNHRNPASSGEAADTRWLIKETTVATNRLMSWLHQQVNERDVSTLTWRSFLLQPESQSNWCLPSTNVWAAACCNQAAIVLLWANRRISRDTNRHR